MKIEISGHHMALTEAIRNYVKTKLQRIEKNTNNVLHAHVFLGIEKQRKQAEATFALKGATLYADAENEDMYAAIDEMAGKLDRQLAKYREKMKDHHHSEEATLREEAMPAGNGTSRIGRILSPERVLCRQKINNKKCALEALAKLLASGDQGLCQNKICETLLERERLGNTALGKGVALPHACMNYISAPIGAFLQLDRKIDYDAADQTQVDLIFGVLVPNDAAQQKPHYLEALAETLLDDKMIRALRRRYPARKIYELLTQNEQ